MRRGSGSFFRQIILFFILFLLSGNYVRASYTYTDVERMTSRFFIEQKWDSVISVGKEAIKGKIDYYYLRLRMGISYYNLEKYYPASYHLNKAIAFNSMDPVPYEYLYSAYLRTNRVEEANSIIKKISKVPGKETARPKTGLFSSVSVEGGMIMSSDEGKVPDAGLFGNDSIYGEEDLYGNSWYFYAGTKLNVLPGFVIDVGYTFLDFKKIKNIAYGYYEDHLDSVGQFWWGHQNYYSFSKTTGTKNFQYDVYQHEFHVGAGISLPWEILLQPAIHVVYDKYSVPVTSVRTYTVIDTAWVDTSAHTFPFVRTEYSFPEKDTSFINYVASLRISKSFSRLKAAISGSYSNLNGLKQKQVAGYLTWYPLGNLSLYEATTLTGFFQKSDKRLIFQQVVGGNPWYKLWVEGIFIWGDITNANLSNASIIYNNTGKVKYIAGATATWMFSEKISLWIDYRFSEKSSARTVYQRNPQGDTSPFKINTQFNGYTTNTLTAGLKWNF